MPYSTGLVVANQMISVLNSPMKLTIAFDAVYYKESKAFHISPHFAVVGNELPSCRHSSRPSEVMLIEITLTFPLNQVTDEAFDSGAFQDLTFPFPLASSLEIRLGVAGTKNKNSP